MIPTANTTALTVATQQEVRLSLQVQEDDWLGSYDCMEVWRSRDGEGGPFEEITGASWAPATLLAGVVGQSPPRLGPLVGKELKFTINAVPFSYTFTGVDPLSRNTIASQLTTAGSDRTLGPGRFKAVVQTDLSIAITTQDTGAANTIEVVDSDGAVLLGLVPGTVAFGVDGRIDLVEGQTVYEFVDPHGSSTYYYKTRFRNATDNLVSEFSQPFSGKTNAGLPTGSLVLGFVRLVDERGRPDANRRVLLYSPLQGQRIDGRTVAGGQSYGSTDDTGYLSFYLVRGSRITVAVSGTQIVRDITVPEDPAVTAFDLLSPDYGTDDVFKVQQPDIDFAVRRTLP